VLSSFISFPTRWAWMVLLFLVSQPENPDFSVPLPRRDTVFAHLDIKPGSCPNPVNAMHGLVAGEDALLAAVVPVTLLGNKFDVTFVDLGSIGMRRADVGLSGGVVFPFNFSYEDTASPFTGDLCDCHELHGDGILDLNMKFDRAELVSILELDEEDNGAMVPLVLTALTGEQGLLMGYDCVRVINH